MRLVLFQPEIPQNVGTLLRLAACLGVAVDMIEPLGFVLSDRHFQRAGLDYLDRVALHRQASWETYLSQKPPGRLIALAAQAPMSYLEIAFQPEDHLLVGPESCGLPREIQEQAVLQVAIPMEPKCRSLNVAVAVALVLGEALRQTQLFPVFDGKKEQFLV